MDDCNIEFFKLETLVERNDCEHCPFKGKHECAEAAGEIAGRTRDSYDSYMQSMNRKSRRKLTDKEKSTIFKALKHEEIKKLLKERGVKLA
jgi:hypothetical protein